MNSISFDVVNCNDNLLYLGGECPVEKTVYVKTFGRIPNRDYTVIYTLDSSGKYRVRPPANEHSWPFLSVVGEKLERNGYDLVYVCKVPLEWYGKRVSRKVKVK